MALQGKPDQSEGVNRKHRSLKSLQPKPSPGEEAVDFCVMMGSLSSITKFTAAFFLAFQSVSDLESCATQKTSSSICEKNITLCLDGDWFSFLRFCLD